MGFLFLGSHTAAVYRAKDLSPLRIWSNDSLDANQKTTSEDTHAVNVPPKITLSVPGIESLT